MLNGIDVSHHQGIINWPVVAQSGIVFTYLKATEGRTVKDIRFKYNFDNAGINNILRGAYHFFHSNSDPEQQADNFIETVTTIGDLPPVLDIEVNENCSTTELIFNVRIWLEVVENRLNYRPIIYTSPSFWNDQMGGTTVFDNYNLWVAHYTTHSEPTLPLGFSTYKFWQYSEQGQVSGINGNSVDLDYFNGTLEELKNLLYQ